MAFYRQPGPVSSARAGIAQEESRSPLFGGRQRMSVEHHQVITLGQVGRGVQDEALRIFRAEVRGLLRASTSHFTSHPIPRNTPGINTAAPFINHQP